MGSHPRQGAFGVNSRSSPPGPLVSWLDGDAGRQNWEATEQELMLCGPAGCSRESQCPGPLPATTRVARSGCLEADDVSHIPPTFISLFGNPRGQIKSVPQFPVFYTEFFLSLESISSSPALPSDVPPTLL